MSEKLSIPENSSGKRPDYDANDPNPGDRAYQEVVLPDANIEAKKEGIDLNEDKVVDEEVTIIEKKHEEISQEALLWNSGDPRKMLRSLREESDLTSDRKLRLFYIAMETMYSSLEDVSQEALPVYLKMLEAMELYTEGKITREALIDRIRGVVNLSNPMHSAMMTINVQRQRFSRNAKELEQESKKQADLLREIFGNRFNLDSMILDYKWLK